MAAYRRVLIKLSGGAFAGAAGFGFEPDAVDLLAKEIMSGEHWLPEVGYSTFYHANYVSPRWASRMNKIDRIGRHIFYKKRNEEPYVVEASTGSTDAPEDSEDSGYLLPTLSLASAVSAVSAVTGSVTDSVSAVAGTTTPPTQAMSLGYAGSE